MSQKGPGKPPLNPQNQQSSSSTGTKGAFGTSEEGVIRRYTHGRQSPASSQYQGASSSSSSTSTSSSSIGAIVGRQPSSTPPLYPTTIHSKMSIKTFRNSNTLLLNEIAELNGLTRNDKYEIARLVSIITDIPVYKSKREGDVYGIFVRTYIPTAGRLLSAATMGNSENILIKNESRSGLSHYTHFTVHFEKDRDSMIGPIHIKTENEETGELTYQARLRFEPKQFTDRNGNSYRGITLAETVSIQYSKTNNRYGKYYDNTDESKYDAWVGQVMAWAFEQVINEKIRSNNNPTYPMDKDSYTRGPPLRSPEIEAIARIRKHEYNSYGQDTSTISSVGNLGGLVALGNVTIEASKKAEESSKKATELTSQVLSGGGSVSSSSSWANVVAVHQQAAQEHKRAAELASQGHSLSADREKSASAGQQNSEWSTVSHKKDKEKKASQMNKHYQSSASGSGPSSTRGKGHKKRRNVTQKRRN